MKPERRGSAWPSAPVPGRVFAIDVAEGLNCGTRSEEEPAMAKRKAAPKEDAAQDDAPSTVPKDSVYIGKSIKPEFIYLRLANRHGLITGATGTGKTVTLQGLAESFSDQGVPVFCADVKGDLSGIAEQGGPRHGSRRATRRSATSRITRPIRSSSGTCSARRAIRSAPPSPNWARSFCPA